MEVYVRSYCRLSLRERIFATREPTNVPRDLLFGALQTKQKSQPLLDLGDG
jgi:hypothetical protein